jgi:hypothetical protein
VTSKRLVAGDTFVFLRYTFDVSLFLFVYAKIKFNKILCIEGTTENYALE